MVKRIFTLAMAVFVASSVLMAQSDYKEFIKERKTLDKYNKEQRNEKASKDARKQA